MSDQRNKAKEVAGKAGEAVSDAAKKVADTATDMTKKAADTTSAAWESGKEAAAKAADSASATASDVAAKIAKATGDAAMRWRPHITAIFCKSISLATPLRASANSVANCSSEKGTFSAVASFSVGRRSDGG